MNYVTDAFKHNHKLDSVMIVSWDNIIGGSLNFNVAFWQWALFNVLIDFIFEAILNDNFSVSPVNWT